MNPRVLALLALCCCLHAPTFAADTAGPAESAVYSADLLALADTGDEQALAKLRGLAEGGHAQAQYDMGTHHLHTIKNFEEDIPRVVSWHQKAAEQGVSHAQIDLAVSLNMPDKPWSDPVQALKWFNVGMALVLKESPDGSQDRYAVFAANNSFQLARSLSKAQVAEAEALSRAWLDAHGVSAKEEAANLGAFLERHKPRKP
jgi:TPR repeat protein